MNVIVLLYHLLLLLFLLVFSEKINSNSCQCHTEVFYLFYTSTTAISTLDSDSVDTVYRI